MHNITSSPFRDYNNGKEGKEVLYKGYYYDVTDFMRKHPGGSVIQFYTEPGEDATHAMDQFHFRSKNKVKMIMKSLTRRPAFPHDVIPKAKALTRHEAMSKDFRELFEQLQAEGYFEPSYRQVILRFHEAVGLTTLMMGFFLYRPQPIYTKVLAAFLSGFAISRFGWVQHEGGHRSLTGNRKVDQFLQDIGQSMFLGASSVWWNYIHNRHHAMPQRLQHDIDLQALPVVTFNAKEVTKKSQFIGFFMKYQGFLYWTFDLFIVTIVWKFFFHPRAQLRNKAYFEMLLNIPSWILLYQVGVFWYFLYSYSFAVIMGLNFSLSHSHLEVTDEPTHWIEYSLTHTADIKGSLFVDWWMGYLNYQIEHHLFPTMPQFRQREICGRVKALAEKHGLPYAVYSFGEAGWLSLKNLYDVGKSVSEKEWDAVKHDRRKEIACLSNVNINT